MDKAVVTIAMGNAHEGIFKVTRPSIEAYAKRIGVDFVVLDTPVICGVSHHYEKFQIRDLLAKYERIIYLDCDLIVRPDCPNLFEVVSEDKLGLFNEGQFKDNTRTVMEACRIHNIELEEYAGEYYNTGVMVISRVFRDIFKKPVIEDVYNHFEQSYLNVMILYHKAPVFDLTHRFNRMKEMDDVSGEPRLNSYIIHYAGILQNSHMIAANDLARWEKGEMNQPSRVVLAAGARLGDVVCAEPVIRYMIEKVYTDYQIDIVSSSPRVFAHLSDRARVMSFEQHKHEMAGQKDVAYKAINAMVPQTHPIWRFMDGGAMNTTDFMSILCLKKLLPDAYRSIRLDTSVQGMTEVLEVLANQIDFKRFVLVHPGQGWPSKTFPAEFWQEVIKGLRLYNIEVGIIGKNTEYENGIGVQDFEVPRDVTDFRELLSLDGLIAAIANASVLISNDSAPVHIAGAFDNRIVLIPTCKHPDQVLPWRKGDKYYNATVLHGKLMADDPQFEPTRLYGYRLRDIPEGHIIEEYLPDPVELVSHVRLLLS
jgi:hypothetical protein